MGNLYILSLFGSHSELSIPHTNFQCYHLGTLILLALQNSHRLSIINCVFRFKPDNLEGALPNLGIFHTIK